MLFVSALIWSNVHGCEVLTFLVVVGAQSHDSEGAAGNLLIEKKHEGSGQHCLQQLGFQTFKQTQHTILPARENGRSGTRKTMVIINIFYYMYFLLLFYFLHTLKATERVALLLIYCNNKHSG